MKPWPGLSKYVLTKLLGMMFLVGMLTTLATAQSTERTVKISQATLPDQVLKIVAIRNLNSEKFPEDFEIEVQNISDKPIYSFYFVPVCSGPMRLGIGRIVYGHQRLMKLENLAGEGDTPILPGEKVTVTPEKSVRESTRKALAEGTIGYDSVKNLNLFFQVLNFGDGSGYHLKEFHRAKN